MKSSILKILKKYSLFKKKFNDFQQFENYYHFWHFSVIYSQIYMSSYFPNTKYLSEIKKWEWCGTV